MDPTTVQRLVKSSDGVEIFAEASGDKVNPHVVLTHGLAFSGAVFDEFCKREDIMSRLYIVRIDMRGHGRSGMPDTPEGHLSHLYAADFKAVVDAFGLKRPVLVGWSQSFVWSPYIPLLTMFQGVLGADICTHLGSESLSGVFYLSSLSDLSLVATAGIITDQAGAILLRASNSETTSAAMADFARTAFASPSARALTYRERCFYGGMGALQPQDVRTLAYMREQDKTQLFDAMRGGMPVFAMYGTSDGLVKGAVMHEALRREGVAKAEVLSMEGLGHALFWERPDDTAETVIGFVERVWKKEGSVTPWGHSISRTTSLVVTHRAIHVGLPTHLNVAGRR
ncbi:Alpha/Beta hydrolase protein [Amylostereum chailletii]|nr:Alpha/Beta hydrolase protein [Amylostereum chailletii]